MTVQAGAILTIADQAGDNYVFGNGAGTANLRSEDTAKVYKTGAGTFTLFGDNGNNFNGEFIMQNGRLNLSRNQALGTGATGRLTITGGQLGRSNTTANFTYSPANLDLHVFRYDLSDAPTFTSQFGAGTLTTLKQNDVEINITNTGHRSRQLPEGSSSWATFGTMTPAPSEATTRMPSAALPRRATASCNFGGDDHVSRLDHGHGRGVAGDFDAGHATLGDYTQATIGTLYLKGGMLATNATRTAPVKNPIVVDGSGGIGHISTTNSLASVVMEFDTDSVVGTSGSLTISNLNSGTGNTVFKPLFTGKNFNFGLPITISSPTGIGRQRQVERAAGRQPHGHADVLGRHLRRRQLAARQRRRHDDLVRQQYVFRRRVRRRWYARRERGFGNSRRRERHGHRRRTGDFQRSEQCHCQYGDSFAGRRRLGRRRGRSICYSRGGHQRARAVVDIGRRYPGEWHLRQHAEQRGRPVRRLLHGYWNHYGRTCRRSGRLQRQWRCGWRRLRAVAQGRAAGRTKSMRRAPSTQPTIPNGDARFGNTSGSGSSLDAGAAVPEPGTLSLALLMIGTACLGRSRRARSA